MIVGLPICIGFITLGERFVSLWIGEAHAAMAGRVMTVLSIGYIVGLPYYTISGVLYGLAAHRVFAILRVVEGVANLTLSVVLVRRSDWSALPLALPFRTSSWSAVFCRGSSRRSSRSTSALLRCGVWTAAAGGGPFFRGVLARSDGRAASHLASFFFWGILSLPAYIVPAWLIALSDEERRARCA